MTTYLIERRYGRYNRDYLIALSLTDTVWSAKAVAFIFQHASTAYAALGLAVQLAKHWPNSSEFAFVVVETKEVKP